ncbi:hypothetical protein BDV95DRAFT_502720 [Massariosphaeria phaeospora]|uniref:Tse2 ADP-ribosyltransferase toxin domain-containing protein n=1 Tax=Massariosphaeria phaeospora TaxID=100035 RepID=A0A7C8M4F9_9PLEO|nr:hypothetical protein BDV95DRAFT_502720 [Massariosphaeria phaeospora]
MLSRIFPHAGVSKNPRLRSMMKELHSRGYSATAIHSSFPATLMRLNAGPAYKSFYCERQIQSKEQITVVESVQSQANHQSAESWTHLQWVSLMPNTFPMQEIVRTTGDYYADDQENGVSVERPFNFTIPKVKPIGMTLPARLVLRREGLYQFSIQPSEPTSSEDLENILECFYSKHAMKQDLDEWLTSHEYSDAVAPENENGWMAT